MPSDMRDDVMPCTWYGPVGDEILSLPIQRLILPAVTENEHHIRGLWAIVHDGITVRNGRRYVKWREDQPGYMSFNVRWREHGTGYVPFNTALFDDLEPRPTVAQDVASDAKHDEQRSQASLKSVSVGEPSPNSQPSDSGEQESNPFRRARLNPSFSVQSTSDNTPRDLFRDTNPIAPPPRVQSSTSVVDRDSTTLTDQSVPRTTSAEADPDDYGLGMRYTGNSQVVNTTAAHTSQGSEHVGAETGNGGPDNIASGNEHHEEVGAKSGSGGRECYICAVTKEPHEFPSSTITSSCNHPAQSCLECLKLHIRAELDRRMWNEVRCPECRVSLDYFDMQKYADDHSFSQYEQLNLRAAMSHDDNFIWCTAGCGSGQIHDSGSSHPIVICLHCGQRSCSQHQVPWHEGLTCKEYGRLIADPENFKPRSVNDDASEVNQQNQIDSDRAIARGLVAGDEAAKRRREFVKRHEGERKKLEAAAEKAREWALKKKQDEEKSARIIASTTKPCPGCGTPIEMKSGCAHMTCTKCKHEFCYECGASHKDIMETDNSAHKETCRFHTNNLE